jgi:hypothetical protein
MRESLQLQEHMLPPDVEEQIRQDARDMQMDEDEAVRTAVRILRGDEQE